MNGIRHFQPSQSAGLVTKPGTFKQAVPVRTLESDLTDRKARDLRLPSERFFARRTK